MALVKKIIEVAWHRNGIGGLGFYAVRFVADIEPTTQAESEQWGIPESAGKQDAHFVAILFDGPGRCAVLCLDLIDSCGVRFAGGNSWRGDHYEPELREAIRSLPSSGSVRVGPFGLPTGQEGGA